ncbi:uncharacterized protein EDB93DRAFT_1089431 [Suillus bovinus]|uniref:uncharacterized protein n=1 Tax=Suillus bovinus TaxID=48563 RepID=UPI001B884901|nr:uncharacterized protein EDB93DRAFT_1089431 [Suillus bovinus]KAG2141382.1 hypothetical protein EDB93DRAFT_1089431 [Suillus bovinus]
MTEHLPTLLQPELEPPQYTLPTTFRIGQHITRHLICPDQLKAHLQLLAAFSHLKQRVVASESLTAGLELDSEKRWVWFVNLAVERRFEKWCLIIKQTDIMEQRLPPIDVIMVWHTYLLNPRQVSNLTFFGPIRSWYAEDTTRISKLKPLAHFTDHFPHLLANPDLLTTDSPQHERVSAWERSTQLPYDPFASAAALMHKSIECPYCRCTILSPFLQLDGKGYAQSNFSITCRCSRRITKEHLGLYKLVKNIVEQEAPDKYLAGTLHTTQKIHNTARGDTIKERIFRSDFTFRRKATDHIGHILRHFQYDVALMHTVLNKHLNTRLYVLFLDRLNKIMGAYTDDRVFSLDLVGAVLRQASFVKRMVDLEWTEPGYFANEVDAVALQHCVARYHAYVHASFFLRTAQEHCPVAVGLRNKVP